MQPKKNKTGQRRPRPEKQSRNRTRPARGGGGRVAFPKDSVLKCLRIPQAILDQNAGSECSDREAASFAKIGWTGSVGVEISSAIKYGFLERPSPGKIKPTDLARKIIRPQEPKDRLDGLREAVLKAPVIGDFYKRYRGRNSPIPNSLLTPRLTPSRYQEQRLMNLLTFSYNL